MASGTRHRNYHATETCASSWLCGQAGDVQTGGTGNPRQFTQEESDAIVKYDHWLENRIVETALAALLQGRPARLNHSSGQITFPMNRRQRTTEGVVLGFDPQGPTDRSAPILSIEARGGNLLGVVWRGARDVCAGLWWRQLPLSHGQFLAIARAPGAELAQEVSRVLGGGELYPVHGPIRPQLTWIDLPLEPVPTLEEIEAMAKERPCWRQHSAAQLRILYNSGALKTNHHRAPLVLWQFGSDPTFVGLPGEPVEDYVCASEKTIGPENLWIAGYCNDHFGYPSNMAVLVCESRVP